MSTVTEQLSQTHPTGLLLLQRLMPREYNRTVVTLFKSN